MTGGKSIFSQCIESPEKESKILSPTRPYLPLGRLLYWLNNHWTKPTISVRDIYVYGPHIDRDRTSAIDLAERLVRRGFLLPVRAHRIDRKVWMVIRETEPMNPTAEIGSQTGVPRQLND